MKRLKMENMAVLLSICLVLGGMNVLPVQAAFGGRSERQNRRNTTFSAAQVSSGDVSAREVKDNGIGPVLELNLGTSAFGKPSSAASGTGVKEWSGTKVYFGETVRTTDKGEILPGVWRVLDNQKLLLQSEQRLGTDAPFDELTGKDGLTVECPVKTTQAQFGKANNSQINSSQVKDSFREKEIAAIKKTQIEEKRIAAGSLINTDKAVNNFGLFLLTAEDVSNVNYGFYSDSTRLLPDKKGGWWTRSAKQDSSGTTGAAEVPIVVGKDGKLTEVSGKSDITESSYVPAFYLDGKKVLFTTPADWKKPDAVGKISEYTGKDIWKLTLSGTDQSLNAALKPAAEAAAQGGAARYLAGASVLVTHADATAVLPESTQISALFTQQINGKETPVYYGKVSDVGAGMSETTVLLPGDMAPGAYSMYLFAEAVKKGNSTDYASALGTPMQITVLGEIVIETMPSAPAITFGQSLKDAVLTGGRAVIVGADGSRKEAAGTFSWKTPDVKPNAAAAAQEFEVIFMPSDSNYAAAAGKASVLVQQLEQAPDMPKGPIEVEYGVKTVKETQNLLPVGWTWAEADREKPLEAGKAVPATAVYENHGGNYKVYTVQLEIRRKECSHPNTEIQNKKDAACTEKGYTGDTYCKDCSTVIAKGTEIPALSHSYTEQITKEPTETEAGVKTFTCSRCGHQYTESIPAKGSGEHNHYYNGTRTLKWLGCEQQGEVEHYCSCGDSYIEVTPALGHDFKEEIVKKATESSAGLKKYTCSRCGHSYTEEIPKLSSGSTNTGNSGNSGNSGSNTGTAGKGTPHIKSNSKVKGWDALNKHISKAKDGDTVQVAMEGTETLPGKTLKALKGRNITLVLDMGDKVQWRVKGTDITEEAPKDVNMRVTKNSGKIPAETAAQTAGERSTMQISLGRENASGIRAELQIQLDDKKAGYYANLFAYNQATKELNHIASPRMDGSGEAVLPAWADADYLVVLDTEEMSAAVPEETPEAPTEEEDIPTSTVPGDLGETENEEDGVPVVVIVAIVAAVIALCALAFVAIRMKTKKEDVWDEE